MYRLYFNLNLSTVLENQLKAKNKYKINVKYLKILSLISVPLASCFLNFLSHIGQLNRKFSKLFQIAV